jgi:hypothetical protein
MLRYVEFWILFLDRLTCGEQRSGPGALPGKGRQRQPSLEHQRHCGRLRCLQLQGCRPLRIFHARLLSLSRLVASETNANGMRFILGRPIFFRVERLP